MPSKLRTTFGTFAGRSRSAASSILVRKSHWCGEATASSSFSIQALRTEDPELHAQFAEDFEFSVPRGVDFISANENVHFSSVLVLHRRPRR
jgi:hypothetical protein